MACAPSRAETSLPACEKRNMLSMNKQHVGPGRVAEVFGHGQGRKGYAQAAPGGSFICPKTMQVCVDHISAGVANFGMLHFQPQVVAFAGPLANSGEH